MIYPEHLFVVLLLNVVGILYYIYRKRNFIEAIKILGFVYAPTFLAICSLAAFGMIDCLGDCDDFFISDTLWFVFFLIPVVVFNSQLVASLFRSRLYGSITNFFYSITTSLILATTLFFVLGYAQRGKYLYYGVNAELLQGAIIGFVASTALIFLIMHFNNRKKVTNNI